MTEKIFLENPYIRQIDGRIVNKKYMNDKYYIKTNKTIFCPNLSHEQSGDKGTINGIPVLDIYEDEDDIVHVLSENILSHKVKLSIDWDNRMDYMQQHSGQHLLSNAFDRLLNIETTDIYIGDDLVYIDIDIPNITEKEIYRVENFTNKIIYSNFSMKTYLSPCRTIHLRSTGEIGIIKIKNIQSYKDHMRVEFVCGYRALKDYSALSKENKMLKNKIIRYKRSINPE